MLTGAMHTRMRRYKEMFLFLCCLHRHVRKQECIFCILDPVVFFMGIRRIRIMLGVKMILGTHFLYTAEVNGQQILFFRLCQMWVLLVYACRSIIFRLLE